MRVQWMGFLLMLAAASACVHAGEASQAMKSIQQEEYRAAVAKSKRSDRMLEKARFVKFVDKDSTSLAGTGLGAVIAGSSGSSIQLEKGTLYWNVRQDYETNYYAFAIDEEFGFEAELKLRNETMKRYVAVEKDLPPDLRARLQGAAKRLAQVKTLDDLQWMDWLNVYEPVLQGAAALTPAQMQQARENVARQRRLAEEVGRLARAYEKGSDAATDEKLVKAMTAYRNAPQLDATFFSPAQRKALHMDEPASHRVHSSRASAIVSSGEEGGVDESDKWEREAAAKKNKRLASPAVRYSVGSTDPYIRFFANSYSVPVEDGTLWLDSVPSEGEMSSSAEYRFYLDRDDSFKTQQQKWIEDCIKGQKGNPDPKGEAMVANMRKAASMEEFQALEHMANARTALGSLRPEAVASFEALLKEGRDAQAALADAYKAAAAKPADKALQRALFVAFQQAHKKIARNQHLTTRQFYDPAGTHDEVPWLLTMDEEDKMKAAGGPTTGMISSSSGLMVSARPVGGKQYIGVTADGSTLEKAASAVLQAAQEYYHNHHLRLTVAEGAAEKAVRGLVEGKSAEELFQSLATRSGTKLVKDPADANKFELK